MCKLDFKNDINNSYVSDDWIIFGTLAGPVKFLKHFPCIKTMENTMESQQPKELYHRKCYAPKMLNIVSESNGTSFSPGQIGIAKSPKSRCELICAIFYVYPYRLYTYHIRVLGCHMRTHICGTIVYIFSSAQANFNQFVNV